MKVNKSTISIIYNTLSIQCSLYKLNLTYLLVLPNSMTILIQTISTFYVYSTNEYCMKHTVRQLPELLELQKNRRSCKSTPSRAVAPSPVYFYHANQDKTYIALYADTFEFQRTQGDQLHPLIIMNPGCYFV